MSAAGSGVWVQILLIFVGFTSLSSGNSSLPQNHRPKITLEKNTLGCKHRRVALKALELARSGSSEAVLDSAA